jgi:hypothetical protein
MFRFCARVKGASFLYPVDISLSPGTTYVQTLFCSMQNTHAESGCLFVAQPPCDADPIHFGFSVLFIFDT